MPSDSDSSDLHTTIIQQVRKKATSTKKKSISKPTVIDHAAVTVAPSTDHGKNEGNDPHWAYAPPSGAVPLDHAVDAGPFDWDAVHDDPDTELWLVRVPESIKAKHLEGLAIDPPSSSSSSRTARIASLTRKHTTYDVWSVGDDNDGSNGGVEVPGGADELRGLACLLPRKRKKGRLYLAPKPISHHVVMSARPPVATPVLHQPVVYQNPARASYPKDVLKHAFVPYGARSEQTRSEDLSMDADVIEITVEKPADAAASPLKATPAKSKESKESKGKKRKVEGDSPKQKKSKKHKADT